MSDTHDVESVPLGQNGVIEGSRRGSLVIDMSTISLQSTQTPSGKHRNHALITAPKHPAGFEVAGDEQG
jgi:3-hydroxyisobutyrate dehydrogenase-like beta-hydroxyacid dehydrogenase